MAILEIENFRKKYPDYNDMDDATLAGKLAEKYPDAYGDLPQRVGMTQDVVVRKDNERIVTNPYHPDFLKTVKDVAGPELYKKSKNALSIAATHDIAPDAAFVITDEYAKKVDESNLYDKAVGSFKAGWGDIYSSIGGILKRKDIGGTLGDTYLEFGEKLKHAYIPPSDQSEFTWRKMIDPEWYATTAMRSVPFGISLVPAAVIGAYGGGAVGTAIGLGKFGVTVLGAIGGASLSRPVESALEAQGAHEEAIQKGMSPEEAEEAANRVFWDNMKLGGLDAAEFATAFLPMGKVAGSTVKRSLKLRSLAATGKLAGVGVMEAGEERYQEKAVMDALGDPASFFDMSNPRLNEASAAGGVFGVGLGGAGSVWTALADKVTKTMPEPVKQVYEQAKKEGQSDIQALDTVAEIPEGKQHIETVIQEMKDLAEGKEVKTVQQIEKELPPIDETTETDLDTLFDTLNASDQEIDENTLLNLLPDESFEGEIEDYTGEADRTQNTEAIQPERPVSENINLLKSQKGEIDLTPLVDIGRSVWLEGKQTYDEFVMRIKEVTKDIWDKIEPYIKDVWNTLANERGSVKISEVSSKEGPGKSTKTSPEAKPEGGKEAIVLPKKEYILNKSQEFINYDKQIRQIWTDYNKATESFTDASRKDAFAREGVEGLRKWDAEVNKYVQERERRIKELGKEIPRHIVKERLEEFPTNGIRNYNLNNPTDKETLLKAISSLDGYIGVRGLYKADIGKKKLRYSRAWDDGSVTKHTLLGTSVLYVGETSDFETIQDLNKILETDVSMYGDSNIKAVVFAKEKKHPHEIYSDVGEVVFPDAKVVGYLNAPVQPLPNPSRSPGEGEQSNIVASIKNTLNEKGSVDLTPLVELGHTIWSEGSQSLESFTTRAKELLADVWDKVKDYVRQAWDVLANERGSISNKPKSLFNEVVKRGGLDPDKLKLNREWNEDVIENGLLGLTKTGGQGLDDIASQLQSEGKIGSTPDEYAGPEDYLLALLRDEMTGKSKTPDKKVKAEQERIKQEAEQFINKESFREGKKAGQKQERAKTKEIIESEKARLQSEYKERTEKAIQSNKRSYINEIADLMKENEWARGALTTAFRMSKEAYRAGNQAGVEEQKQIIRKMLDRRSLVKNVRDYFGLSDDDLRKISRKNPLLMDDLEFKHYMQDIEELSVYYAEKAQAKFELMLKIESKRLKKVENFREAMKLPAIQDMTPKQMKEFAELLEPYEKDDVFLGKRELEEVDNTDWKGIRTWREAQQKGLEEINKKRTEAGREPVTLDELKNIRVGKLDRLRWDSALREQNPFYEVFVNDITKAMMGADLAAHNVENDVYKLAKKSDKSRKRTLVNKAIPQDKLTFEFMETPDEYKEHIAKQMTPEQLDFVHYMTTWFAKFRDYLISTKAGFKGRENYITHMRQSSLERLIEGGYKPVWDDVKQAEFKDAFKEFFKNYIEDESSFRILDDATGDILPLNKFFQFELHRTGYLEPSTNVTKVFLTYVKMAERKKAFDSILSKFDIFAQSLTPETYTETGLETDRTLKKFVYQYINNKKGRRLSFDGILQQGGPIDMAIRGIRTFTTVLDLGLSPITQGATFVGEQVATAVMLGPKVITKATARMKTDKGKRILEKYEAFTGRSFWEEFTAPGKEITERLTETLFAGFHISNVLANKQFLLGSLTDQEWNSEEITTERLAEMKLDMGRFRPVPGTNSLVGSTSIGNAVMQYKTWAVSMSRNVLVDIGRFTKDLKNKPAGEALTTREAKELYRIVGITSAAIIVGAMAGADEDDKTMLGKLRTRAYKEAMSLTQGMNPAFWLGTPRILTWAYQTATALKQIVTLEEYKTKEGYKGVNNLGKQVIPRTIRDLTPEENKGGRR